MSRRVVITGMGILSSLGRGLERTYEGLCAQEDRLSEVGTFLTDHYAAGCAGIIEDSLIDTGLDSGGTLKLDRSSHLLYTACRDALESASVDSTVIDSSRVPIYLGTTSGGTLHGQMFHRDYLLKRNEKKRRLIVGDYLACNQGIHIAREFRLGGEVLIINNACASGVNSIGIAFKRILQGSENFVIAGGYDVLSEFTYAGFNSLQLMAPGKCRPFDKNRGGLVLGEGAGILVIEELSHAIKRGARIFAEIIGFGQTTDAYHLTKPDPEACGAIKAMTAAIESAGIKPEHIDYINAHGTGTLANDPMESRAINSTLSGRRLRVPVSSTKPMTGHTLGASGAIEAIFSVISIDKNIVPVNLNYETPDPECELNIVTEKTESNDIKVAMSNSFGFGGSNSTLIVKELNEY